MTCATLAIDTSGHACAAAILGPENQRLFSKSLPMARGHAAALAPLMQEALDACSGLSIGAIAVTRGPGGFTGMRVGLAYARTFALAKHIPVYGFSVFEALRLTVGQEVPCLIDTRRGDFFYDQPTARLLGLPDLGEEVIGITAKPAELPKECPLAGSIWQTDSPLLKNLKKPSEAGWIEPSVEALAKAAKQKCEQGQEPDPKALSPLYVRAPSLG